MEAIDRESLAALRDALAKHEVEYLFLGKMAAILQGYPDTTQDADLFLEKTAENGERLSRALRELGFEFDEADEAAIRKGQDFVQLRQGPFPVDLVYAPDGIDRYEDARGRGHEIHGYRVCAIQDVIESKQRSNRAKDRESLPLLRDFATYLERKPPAERRPLPPRSRGGERKPTQPGGDDSVPMPPPRPKRSGKATSPKPNRRRP